MLAEEPEFEPYVSVSASRDSRWKNLAANKEWSSIHLLRRGERSERLARLPNASRLLGEVPLADCPPHAPECFISRLAPGVVLPPHHGLSNIKLTVHLPIDIPAHGCSITVAGETRVWSRDDFLIFDDSFLHSAKNESDLSRTVMIFDVWHPGLCDDERRALALSIRVLDAVQAVAHTRLHGR
jgi:aspartyl/asparaginyl beta-hydroxylase (cupin superfamily)